mmetsp:Transcript_21099/g.25376  ORF Transcript_21099/g.25376 Transcript_21099/m.25376 type:complete len:241 (-) Transcript_21099:421-1143(-)
MRPPPAIEQLFDLHGTTTVTPLPAQLSKVAGSTSRSMAAATSSRAMLAGPAFSSDAGTILTAAGPFPGLSLSPGGRTAVHRTPPGVSFSRHNTSSARSRSMNTLLKNNGMIQRTKTHAIESPWSRESPTPMDETMIKRGVIEEAPPDCVRMALRILSVPLHTQGFALFGVPKHEITTSAIWELVVSSEAPPDSNCDSAAGSDTSPSTKVSSWLIVSSPTIPASFVRERARARTQCPAPRA